MLILGYIFKASGDFEFGEVFLRITTDLCLQKYKDEMDYMINVPKV